MGLYYGIAYLMRRYAVLQYFLSLKKLQMIIMFIHIDSDCNTYISLHFNKFVLHCIALHCIVLYSYCLLSNLPCFDLTRPQSSNQKRSKRILQTSREIFPAKGARGTSSSRASAVLRVAITLCLCRKNLPTCRSCNFNLV